MCDLWQHFSLLRDLVHRATAVRSTVSRFLPSKKVLQEIEFLLTGQSIKLPPVATPLAERGLLTAKEIAESVAPDRLLEAMTRSFQVAKDAVVAVDQVWERYPHLLTEYDEEVLALQQLADKLEEEPLVGLTYVRDRIAALRGLVESDPMAVKSEGESIAARLQNARARLDEIRHSRDHLQADLTAARSMLEQLQTLARAAQTAQAERRQKIERDDASLPEKPPDDRQVAALAPWLATLEQALGRGQWKPVRVGLGKWTAVARDCVAALESARREDEARLQEREELRGLLAALRAKAQDRGLAGDAALAALAQEAWQLLHSRPTPLGRARQKVMEYQARLV
jgi:DNA repair exonuclease SbcCD ATPase subunit